MEEMASGLKPEAPVKETQMNRKWGRMAFKAKKESTACMTAQR